MTEGTQTQNTSPVDPVFPRFFTNGEEPQHKLVGLIGYGLYEEARREWVDDFKEREGRYPTPTELRAYETSWTSSRLEGLKNAAVQILASYADSIAREIEAQALRGALKGGFLRSVVRWLFSAVLFVAGALGLMIALSRAGADPVGMFLGLLRPPESTSSRPSPPATSAPSPPAPGVGTPVTPTSPGPAPTLGTPVTPPPRSGR
jgi:hypothetical protein